MNHRAREATSAPIDSGNKPCTFTVLTPTYNRAHTLPRTYDSLKKQTFRDFEWLIVDDGSEDGTSKLVKQWQEEADFPIRYYWQENQGKHIAHNTGVREAKGKLAVILDSDDMLADNALERLKHHWENIPRNEREHFAGVEGLVAYLDGRISGDYFPKDIMDSDYIELHAKYGIRGDKKGAIRTDILRNYPFPQFPGEKHIRPSLLWKRLAHRYRFRYINEIIQLVEQLPGGLSSNRFRLRMNSPKGFRLYYQEEVNKNGKYDNTRRRLSNCAKYVRYSLHAGIGYRQQWRDIETPLLWLLSLPEGTMGWLRDRIRLLIHSRK